MKANHIRRMLLSRSMMMTGKMRERRILQLLVRRRLLAEEDLGLFVKKRQRQEWFV